MPRDRVQELIPSTFLPHLPRSTSTLSPLRTPDLLSHIAVLRELYLPPIHGGFTPADTSLDERPSARREERERRSKQRERRFSAGLVETMDGLGLGLELDPNGPAPGPGDILGSGATSLQDVREEPDSGSEYDSEDDESDEADDDGGPSAHLDPFEREWSQKWLNGVVRRAQTILEELEGQEDAEEESAALIKAIEAVLRDATAVLAMMAGTSGECPHSALPTFLEYLRSNLISKTDGVMHSCRLTHSASPLPDQPLSRTGSARHPTRYTPQPQPLPRDDHLPRHLVCLPHFAPHVLPKASQPILLSRSAIPFQAKWHARFRTRRRAICIPHNVFRHVTVPQPEAGTTG
jgi:hypothetical protein